MWDGVLNLADFFFEDGGSHHFEGFCEGCFALIDQTCVLRGKPAVQGGHKRPDESNAAILRSRKCADSANVGFNASLTDQGRSAKRYTNFNPDHVSSTAQIFTSTRPFFNPISRTMFSVRSVGTPDAFLGQLIHSVPFGFNARFKLMNSRSSA